MIKKMLTLTTAFLILSVNTLTIASNNKVDDYVGFKSMILVEEKNNLKSFKYCEKNPDRQETVYETKGNLTTSYKKNLPGVGYLCVIMGSKAWYSQNDLDKISKDESIEAHLKTLGVVVGASLFALSGYGAGVILGLAAGSSSASVVIGSTVAATGIFSAFTFSEDKINPVIQYKQASVLKREGLQNSQKIELSDNDILEVKELLEQILN